MQLLVIRMRKLEHLAAVFSPREILNKTRQICGFLGGNDHKNVKRVYHRVSNSAPLETGTSHMRPFIIIYGHGRLHLSKKKWVISTHLQKNPPPNPDPRALLASQVLDLFLVWSRGCFSTFLKIVSKKVPKMPKIILRTSLFSPRFFHYFCENHRFYTFAKTRKRARLGFHRVCALPGCRQKIPRKSWPFQKVIWKWTVFPEKKRVISTHLQKNPPLNPDLRAYLAPQAPDLFFSMVAALSLQPYKYQFWKIQ